MPKEKTLFFIGIWIILLSNFIGLPTDIKNYLFIATAIVIFIISYSSKFSEVNIKDNFFTKKNREPKVEIKKEESVANKNFGGITSLRKESDDNSDLPEIVSVVKKRKVKKEEMIDKVSSDESKEVSIDFQNPFADISKSYEPVIKVRRARIKPKAKLVREEVLIESNYIDTEEDDVVVISGGGDEMRN